MSNLGVVSVQAQALRSPFLLYSNTNLLSEQEALEDYAYAIPSELETALDYEPLYKSFSAERYGGGGIGTNGGAGRCGTLERFQIKGIGRTPLIGRGVAETDFWHSHGGISVIDAIQEAIWGEVFTQALPYGATRIAAIIATGTKCWYEGPGGIRSTAPRALVVREAVVRPAHFMRAPYFRSEAGLDLKSDVARVRESLSILPALLPADGVSSPSSLTERLLSGLLEATSRMAHQCASAQSRKLMHGALYASNIALDGRWLDFGTATLLPTYANTKSCGAPRGFSTLWEEHTHVESTLEELCFYINKYFPFPTPRASISATLLKEHYRKSYQVALGFAAIRLFAIPDELLREVYRAVETTNLAETMIELLRTDSHQPIESAVLDLSIFGNNDIGDIICILANYSDKSLCDRYLESKVTAKSLRLKVIEQYDAFVSLVEMAAKSKGIPTHSIRTLCFIGGMKAKKSIPELYRHNMMTENRRTVLENVHPEMLSQAIRARVANISNISATLFAPCNGLVSPLWREGNSFVQYDSASGRWQVQPNDGATTTHYRLPASNPELRDMHAYYGDSIALLL